MREGESQDKRLGELSKAARQPGDNIGSHRVDIIARGQHRQPKPHRVQLMQGDIIGRHTGP